MFLTALVLWFVLHIFMQALCFLFSNYFTLTSESCFLVQCDATSLGKVYYMMDPAIFLSFWGSLM